MEIHQERFEAWLENQPDDRVIDAIDPRGCFLCSFLKETAQCSNPAFSYRNWTPDFGNTQQQRIPEWAQALVSPGWVSRYYVAGSYRTEYGYTTHGRSPVSCADMKQRYKLLFGPSGTFKPEQPEQDCFIPPYPMARQIVRRIDTPIDFSMWSEEAVTPTMGHSYVTYEYVQTNMEMAQRQMEQDMARYRLELDYSYRCVNVGPPPRP